MIKKIISAFLTTRFLAYNTSGIIGVGQVFASEKLPNGSEKYILPLVDAKIMSVYKDGTFRPEEQVTREKMARFLDAAIKYINSTSENYNNLKNYKNPFKDVKKTDFYFPYIMSMYDKGILKGYPDKTFRGKNKVTRAEAISMIIKSYKEINNLDIPNYSKNPKLLKTKHRFNDVNLSDPFYNSIYYAVENNFIAKNKFFRPNDFISKYETSILIYRILLQNGKLLKKNTNNISGNTNSVFYKGTKVNAKNVSLSILNKKTLKLSFNNDSKFNGKIPYINKDDVVIKINNNTTNKVTKVTLIEKTDDKITYGLVLLKEIKPNDSILIKYEDNNFKISASKKTNKIKNNNDNNNDDNDDNNNDDNNNSEDGINSDTTNTGTGTDSTNTGTGTDSTNTGTGTDSTNTGTISISLSSDNPSNQLVPNNATNVDLLKVVLETPDNTVLRSITIKRIGLGSSSDIKNVKLYINGLKVSSNRTFNNSDNKATFYLTNLTQKLPAGKNILSIKGDFNGVNDSISKIQIESASSIDIGGAQINGNFPITGNEVRTAGVAAGTINYTTYAGNNGIYYIGDTKKEFLKFDLAANSVESVYLKSLRFKLIGSARITDVANLTVYDSDNVVVASSGNITPDGYVNFNLGSNGTGGYFLEKGVIKTMYLKGDIVNGRSNSTIAFDIENPSDIFGIGKTYNFGVNVNKTSGSVSPNFYTIKGGKLSISLASDSAPAKDISPRSNNVELAKFNLVTQGDAINIKRIKLLLIAKDNHSIYPNSTNSEIARVSNIENFKVVVGNNLFVYGPIDFNQPSSDITYTLVNDGISGTNHSTTTLTNDGVDMKIIDIDDDFTIPKNSTTPMVVTANFNSNVSKADTYQVKLLVTKNDGTSLILGENETTQDDISSSDITPSGSNVQVSGNVMTIDTAKATISLRPVPGSKMVSKNSKQVDLFGFNISAGTASDLKINSIKISRDSDLPNSSISDLENLTLYAGDKKISGSIGKSFVDSTVDYVLFDDLKNEDGSDFKIKAGQQYDFVVKADISSNALTGNKGRFYIASKDDINIIDVNGQTLSNNQKMFGDTVINSDSNTQAPIFTIQQGGLGVSVDNDTPIRKQFTAGELGKPVFKIKFSAKNEDIYIKTLKLKVNGIGQNVYKLELFDGSTSIGNGPKTVIGGVATWSLSNNNRIKIPAGTDKTITVKADIMTSDNNIAQSGGDFSISLDNSSPIEIESESGNSQPVVGYKTATTKPSGLLNNTINSTESNIILSAPQSSWNVGDIIKIDNEEMLIVDKLSDSNYNVIRGINGTTSSTHLNNTSIICYDSSDTTTISGNSFTVYYTYPSEISSVDLPTTNLQAGQEQVIGAFKIKASANSDTVLNKLTLKRLRVSKAGSVQISNVKIYNKSDSSIYTNGVFVSGNKLEFDLSQLNGGKNEITEGNEATFEIKAMVDYVPAGATLSININDIQGTSFADSDLEWNDGVGTYYNLKLDSDTINGKVLSTSAQNPVGVSTNGPTIQSIVFNGTADDKISNGDTVIITWDELIDPSTILTTGGSGVLAAGRTVTGVTGYLERTRATNSIIKIPNIVDIVAGGDTSSNGSQSPSTVNLSLDNSGKVLTITVVSAGALNGATVPESFTSSTPFTNFIKNINGQNQKNTSVTPTGDL